MRCFLKTAGAYGGEIINISGLEFVSIVGVGISCLLLFSTIAHLKRFQFVGISCFSVQLLIKDLKQIKALLIIIVTAFIIPVQNIQRLKIVPKDIVKKMRRE
jgi:hypothetical protein